METTSSTIDEAALEALRQQRAELRESMSALEQALAGPWPGRVERWTERVHVALVELSADLREHVRLTEGSEGLYVDVLATSPRLAGAVTRLLREHTVIDDLLEELIAATRPAHTEDVEQLRGRATTLLGLLVSHRQRGSDLLYEAYQFDVGGED